MYGFTASRAGLMASCFHCTCAAAFLLAIKYFKPVRRNRKYIAKFLNSVVKFLRRGIKFLGCIVKFLARNVKFLA